MSSSTTWADLRPRVMSGAVMAALGAAAIWAGGLVFLLALAALVGAMQWELARMTRLDAPRSALALGAAGAAAIFAGAFPWLPLATLCAGVALVFLLPPRAQPALALMTALAILAAGHGLLHLREVQGAAAIMWLVGVVVASDIAGYFVGRALGGPKFWPAISPKKTWSGTVAGWAAAAAVGFGFAAAGYGGAALVLISPVIAFAGQMGDIGESLLKRRTGVKDSSALIPGHGGVMDRFDAVVGASVLVLLLEALSPLPFAG